MVTLEDYAKIVNMSLQINTELKDAVAKNIQNERYINSIGEYIEKLEARISNATEYIEKYANGDYIQSTNELLDILKGEK